MPLSPADQERHKLARVREELGRKGQAIGWVSGAQRRYRRRIRMRVDEDGRPRFFNEDKSHTCVVLTASLVKAVDAVCEMTLENVQHLEVRGADLDGHAGLLLTSRPDTDPGKPAPLPAFVVGNDAVSVWQRWSVRADVWSYVPLNAFLQVNEEINTHLLDALVGGALDRGAGSFLDPFTGAGNHALALAAAGIAGVAADRHGGAIAALQAAATEQGLQIETRSGLAAETAIGARRPDLLVANPPRAGLRDAADSLAALGADHVALITCTATALARDLAAFESKGYALQELVAFDMFPNTEHVELLAWLRR